MNKKATVEPGFRNKISYHTILLGGTAFVFGVLITFAHITTHDDIALRLQEDMLASLHQVLPPTIYDNKPLDDTLTLKPDGPNQAGLKIYRARKAGKIVGVAFEITGTGYGGAIEIIMGVDKDGKILGVRVISHHETPGLGDKIELSKSDWITKFKGLFFGNPKKDKWKVKKDGGYFDQFTGATITPRGVVKAIKHGLELFEKNRSQILGINTPLKTSLNGTTIFFRRYG